MQSAIANSLISQNKRRQESGSGKCGIYLVELCFIYLLESNTECCDCKNPRGECRKVRNYKDSICSSISLGPKT